MRTSVGSVRALFVANTTGVSRASDDPPSWGKTADMWRLCQVLFSLFPVMPKYRILACSICWFQLGMAVASVAVPVEVKCLARRWP